MKKWLNPQPVTVLEHFRHDVGGHPLIAQTLYRRGFTTFDDARKFMHWHHYTPTAALELPDMDKAVSRLQQAIEQKQLICVWGDFDVDGQTATALLVSALRELNANVTSYIPHRMREGHGIYIGSLQRIIDGGASLILTCDTGIDAHDAVNYANSRGVDVVITDHHKLPDILPNAAAAVNSRRVSANHPLRHLPGVGVAYKLIEALSPQHDWTHLLDLVALGIVADVAVQQGDTRYLLQRGLANLSVTKRLGLQVMMELARVNPADINEMDIGFRLAPRLNAIGRLDDANPTTELLTTNDLERARILANQLEGLNKERQRLSDAVWQGVQAELDRTPGLLKHAALVVAHEEWHTGVVGIVANKCVEAYARPALLLKAPPDDIAKGSARSIAGVDITDAIADNAHLLRGYGGHTMAAGVALDTDKIDEFRRGLSASVRKQLAQADLTPTLQIDAYMSLAELDMPLVNDVSRLAPFGAGNPPLVLATRGLTITGQRQLGQDAKHFRLTVEDDVGTERQVVWWNADDIPSGRFDLAYTVRANTFRGEREVLIEWLDYRQDERDTATVDSTHRTFAVIDYRQTLDKHKAYEQVIAGESDNLLVWGEVVSADYVNAVGRGEATLHPALLVWTAPPDSKTWDAVLEAVQPERIYLFGVNPNMDKPEPFLKRLGGLVKYALKAKDGVIQIKSLAAATAQTNAAVRAGLDWLAAKGQITISDESSSEMVLTSGGTPTDELKHVTTRLQRLLNESAAYRAYWHRTQWETS